METLKFKTNIKCGGCVAGVTPYLNELTAIEKWGVDLLNPDRILTVEVKSGSSGQTIINAVEVAGFKAAQL